MTSCAWSALAVIYRKSDGPVVAASFTHATACGPDKILTWPAERFSGVVQGSGSTLSVTEPTLPDTSASIVTSPVDTPVTTPDCVTVATAGVRLRHSTAAPVILAPSPSKTEAESVTVAPTTMIVCGVVIATDAGACGAGSVGESLQATIANAVASNKNRFTMSVPFDDVGFTAQVVRERTPRATDCPYGHMLNDQGLGAETRKAAARVHCTRCHRSQA